MYTRFVSKVLFPLHERLKGHDSVARREALERSQWLGHAELQSLQLQRLNRLLEEAGRQVPYYRELFTRLGVKPGGLDSLADLQRLPLLTKALIVANCDTLKNEQAQGLAGLSTGGSSGEPLRFFIGKDRVSHDVAAKWRATRWWGVDIGDPEVVVWGSPIELGAQDRLRGLRDKLMRTELLPAFEMSASRLDGFIAAIRRKRPAMLFGYPSALSHIARHARERGIAMDDLGIKVAFVTSERLYEEQRAQISTVFGCPVANGYGGRDAGFIAHECPSGGMHLSAEDVIVELLDPAGWPVAQGKAGEIVVTHLATGEFPFIRYRTGDIAVMDDQQCACGRGLPMLKEIQGRTTDFVIAADGTVLHGLALIYILRDLPGLRAFKVIQHSRDCTEVQLVPESSADPGANPIATSAIIAGFKRRLGAAVEIRVKIVESIEAEKSGKFRYIVSHAS